MNFKSKKILKVFFAIIGLLVLLAGGLYLFISPQLGRAPSEIALKKFESLSYFANGEFQSAKPIPFYKDKVTGGGAGFLRFFLTSEYAPKRPFPNVLLRKDSFGGKPANLAFYWLGHSTAILEVNGARILVDPVFENAAPVPGVVKRYQASPLRREDLPVLDFVLISHDHYDHLEYSTIRYLKDRDVRFIVPLGVGEHLKAWGVPEERIRELGWSETYSEKNVNFTAEKGVHYSGRLGSTRNKALWASYIISGAGKKIFWSGDTGYGDHFAEIGKRYGPFDVAAIEIDGWNNGWPNTHMFPKEAVQAHKDLNAKHMLPIHWGVFDLALHPWDESIEEVLALAKKENISLVTPMMGEKLIPGQTQTGMWWRESRVDLTGSGKKQ